MSIKSIKSLIVVVLAWSFLSIQAQVPKNKKVYFSFSERTRLTAFDHVISLDDASESWVFARYKTNLGLRFLATKSLKFQFSLGNESRSWFSPKSKKSQFKEVFVDQLYLHWKGKILYPVELTLGRQNIMLDEGFICMDGQPLTGSRSIYFNALKLNYTFKNSQLLGFTSYNPQTDDILPIINQDQSKQLLEEQSNFGLGLYYKKKVLKINLSTYYFYKASQKNKEFPTASKVNTIGFRVVVPVSKSLEFTSENAIQFGSYGDSKQLAYGGYFHFDYLLRKEFRLIQKIALGGFYLSGDKPNSSKMEAWNPLWSRWPKWSESYIYTLIIENKGRVAYWSNIASLNVNLKGKFSDKISYIAAYHRLYALQDNSSEFTSGKGKTRGDLFTFKINFKLDKNWSGHLLWEHFIPGNFYFSSADSYQWLRFELLYKI